MKTTAPPTHLVVFSFRPHTEHVSETLREMAVQEVHRVGLLQPIAVVETEFFDRVQPPTRVWQVDILRFLFRQTSSSAYSSPTSLLRYEGFGQEVRHLPDQVDELVIQRSGPIAGRTLLQRTEHLANSEPEEGRAK